MNKLYFVLFLVTNVFSQAQFVPYELTDNLVYKHENGVALTYFFNPKDSEGFAYVHENNGREEDPTYHIRVNFNHKIFEAQAKVANEKYLDLTGYSEWDQAYKTGGKNYRMEEVLWTVEPYKNCIRLETAHADGEKLILYFADRQDGVDYSGVTNTILQVYSLPEILNYTSFLKKGWVMVYAEIENSYGGNTFLGLLQSEKRIQNFNYQFSEKQMKYILDYKETGKPYVMDDPVPVYCAVFGANEGVDSKTFKELGYFYGAMCSYYDDFGRFRNQEFQDYYNAQIEVYAKKLLKDKTLNAKQIVKFREEAKSYAPYNATDQLERFDD